MVKPPFRLKKDSQFKLRHGKVRDIVEADDVLFLIATDRVSAFDVVMPTLIPGKGKLLTKLSHFWFDFFKQIPNHRIVRNKCQMSFDSLSHEVDIPNFLCLDYVSANNTMIVQKANVIPIEFVVRGYIDGTRWQDLIRRSGWHGVRGVEFSEKMRKR